MKPKQDWLIFMYRSEIFYPFLVAQIVFICFFMDIVSDDSVAWIWKYLCIGVFFGIIAFYAASGRRFLKMLSEATKEQTTDYMNTDRKE